MLINSNFWILEWTLEENSTITVCVLVAQLCLTLCNPMDCCTPGFSVLHHLLELVQAHVY